MELLIKKLSSRKPKLKTISLDPLKGMNQLCVPVTRDVLMHQLSLQVSCSFPSLDEEDISELVSDVTRDRDNSEIISIMEDPRMLQGVISEAHHDTLELCSRCSMKDVLGEELFGRVAAYDSQLSAQITGMLLELDEETLGEMLSDPGKLESALIKARREFLEFRSCSDQPEASLETKEEKERENIGEEVFAFLSEHFTSTTSSKITGMLLELDLCDLRRLLGAKDELMSKAQLAFQALEQDENN